MCKYNYIHIKQCLHTKNLNKLWSTNKTNDRCKHKSKKNNNTIQKGHT